MPPESVRPFIVASDGRWGEVAFFFEKLMREQNYYRRMFARTKSVFRACFSSISFIIPRFLPRRPAILVEDFGTCGKNSPIVGSYIFYLRDFA